MSREKVFSSASRTYLMRLLQVDGPATASELGARAGLHVNTVREHLERLSVWGLVMRGVPSDSRRGRPPVLYSLLGPSVPAGSTMRRKVAEASARGDLMRRIWPLTSVLASTDAEHQLDALDAHLEDCGVRGDRVLADGLVLEMTPCVHLHPKLRRSAVFQVHLDLIDGVLSAAGGSLLLSREDSLCRDKLCRIELVQPLRMRELPT